MQTNSFSLKLPTNYWLWPILSVSIFEENEYSPAFFTSLPVVQFADFLSKSRKREYLEFTGFKSQEKKDLKENINPIKKTPNHDNLFTKKLLLSSTKGKKYSSFLMRKIQEFDGGDFRKSDARNSRFLKERNLNKQRESNFSSRFSRSTNK